VVDSKQLFADFAKKWCDSDDAVPQSDDSIALVERELGMRLPVVYRDFATRYGNVYVPDLLEAIEDADADIRDVQEFHSLQDAVEMTREYERAGMPGGYFGFAFDCMGNMFCFKTEECSQPDQADAPFWFFDHDFVTMELDAPSFVSFLSRFVELDQEDA